MNGRSVLYRVAGAALALLAAASAAAERPAVLERPALASARAANSFLFAVTRAGSRLVAAGERGVIVTSDDNGRSWQQAQVPVSTSIVALRFATQQDGWAVGHLGTVLSSADGGRTWTRRLDGLAAIEALRQDRAADPALVEQWTADGPDKPFFDLWFDDAQRGLAVGAFNLCFRTIDAGSHWTPCLQDLPNPQGFHLYGLAVHGPRMYLAGEQGLLLRSDDGGAHFQALTTPYPGSYFGVLASGDDGVLAYGLRGNVFHSADGGTSWRQVPADTRLALSAGAVLQDGRIALVSSGGELLLADAALSHFRAVPLSGAGPLTGIAQAADGGLILSGAGGVRRVALPPAELAAAGAL